MDDDYLNEVLPRWQFWKEYLIEQLGRYTEGFKEGGSLYYISDEEVEKIKKINTEMIEKIKGIKNRTDFEKVPDEIMKWRENIEDICGWKYCDYVGAFWGDITNGCKLSSWLNIETLAYAIYHKTSKKITE